MPDHERDTEVRLAGQLRHEAQALLKVADRLDPRPVDVIRVPDEVLTPERAEEIRLSFKAGPFPRETVITEGATVTEIVTVGLSQGAVLVTAERDRQIREEGYVDDARHTAAELAWAAACYVTRAADDTIPQDHKAVPTMWPWTDREWKPKPDRVRNLVIAAALIVAEIDRSLTAGEPEPKETSP